MKISHKCPKKICNRVSVTFKRFFVICTFQYDLTKHMDSEMSNRSRITTKTTKWLRELRLKSLGPGARYYLGYCSTVVRV